VQRALEVSLLQNQVIDRYINVLQVLAHSKTVKNQQLQER